MNFISPAHPNIHTDMHSCTHTKARLGSRHSRPAGISPTSIYLRAVNGAPFTGGGLPELMGCLTLGGKLLGVQSEVPPSIADLYPKMGTWR